MMAGVCKRKQLRLKNYDYSQEGTYYVTVCTQNRECLFGVVCDGEMKLNEYGEIVKHEWGKTGEIRKNIELDEFIVMPNHIHGIINIVGAHCNVPDNEYISGDGYDRGTCNVPLRNRIEKFGRSISNSIPTIIKLFKSTTTKQINQLRNTSGKSIWQRGFYEHIVRDEKDLNRIREYIMNNPAKWDEDKYYKKDGVV